MPAEMRHVEPIAQGMRQADRREVFALGIASGRDALLIALDESLWSGDVQTWSLIDDEAGPVAMGGIIDRGSGNAAVWLLGTDWMDAHPVTVMRLAREEIAKLAMRFQWIGNWVDDSNERAKRWLATLGFELGPPVRMGPLSLPFRPFVMRLEVSH